MPRSDGASNNVLKSQSLPLRLHSLGVAMSSPIALRDFDPNGYRIFVRTLSDEELVKAGKRSRFLSGNGKIVTTMPCAFYEQLKICREEYRRRHPKRFKD